MFARSRRSLGTVNELFAPPGTHWRPVSPVLARLRRTVLVASAAVVLVVVGGLALVVAVPAWLPVVAVVAMALGVVGGWVLIGRNARWWGYAERDEDLFIKHGAMFRTLVVVPYGRMQYVDVQAGPLEQAFKIASVHLHTASPGTSARIPGLPADEAARLRDRLTSLGEAQAAGL
jgi:membrane protein YdbS with pleckstrin-like domain